MAYDFKKEFPAFYKPTSKPHTVNVGPITYAAVAGTGDPNQSDGAYSQAVTLLYAFSYTIKMSKKGSWQPEGYFDFVVPPLEGLWWAGAGSFQGSTIVKKNALSWISLIRQPDFVTPDVFEYACTLTAQKKPELAEALNNGKLRLLRFTEGPCAQITHIGPYDTEAESIQKLTDFIGVQGLTTDITEGGESPEGHEATRAFDADKFLSMLDAKKTLNHSATNGLENETISPLRLHHEIYLSDPRKTAPEKLKTIIRHPVR